MSLLDGLTKSLLELYSEKLNDQQKEELLQCLDVLLVDEKYNKFKNIFPEEGPLNRTLYKKHCSFFSAGSKYRERFFLACNRGGKSEAGAFEVVSHATGLYRDWWDGHKCLYPPMIWIGGDTATTCRDIIQIKLLGEIGHLGSGLIPKDLIVETKTRRGTPDAIETIRVKHVSGGTSTIVLKTYEQGRETWQGSNVDVIWGDEEMPQAIYGECLIRLMTTNGIIFTTFTPLSGLTDLVVSALDNSQETDAKYPKHVTTLSWDEVPHITEEMKAQMLEATPPQLRDARSKGIPTVGSGLIYPIDHKNIIVDDFKIPLYWPKLYALDVGWNNTAAPFGAWDRDNDVIYIYSEYKRGGQEGEDMPLVHTTAIQSRGKWMKGVIDPASRGRSQVDGQNLYMIYRKLGLNIFPAENSVESGIYTVWDRLNTGRLKIMKSCSMTLRELALYHRDEKGRIVKTNDHLLDALRYLVMAAPSMWTLPSADKDRPKVVQMNTYMNACV